MADKKTYYYLKLKEGFFDSEDMLLLQGMKDGYIYSDILLKLYLMSLRQDGRLMYRGIIPYTPDMVATITHHQVGTVEKAMKVLTSMGFIEILDNGAIYMLDIQNFIGRSSNEADRKREYRATINAEKSRIIEDKEGQMSRQMSDVRAPENRDKRTENKDNKDNKNISLELKGSKQNTFISLPLITGSGNYDVTFDYLNSLRELFPALDVEQEFRSMAAWLDSHPRNRKTPRGIKRFITGWLERSQNSMPASRTPQAPAATKNMSTDQYIRNYNGRYPYSGICTEASEYCVYDKSRKQNDCKEAGISHL